MVMVFAVPIVAEMFPMDAFGILNVRVADAVPTDAVPFFV